MAPPVGSSLSSSASSTSSSVAAVIDWHTIAIYFICLFAGTVLVILLILCLPKDIFTRPSLLFRWRAARQAKRQQQQRDQRQRPIISIPLQNIAPSSSPFSSSSFSSQTYNNAPNKSRIPNPHPFGSASWRDHEDRSATAAETAALKIESLHNQLEMLMEALDHERAAMELVEGRNRELSFALKMQKQKQSGGGGGGKDVDDDDNDDGYDEYDFDAVDPEVLERVYERIHRPLDEPKPKTASPSSSAPPNHPPTYPEAQQQQQQQQEGSQISPTRALSPLARHPPPFSFYSPDDDPIPQPSSSSTTPPPPPPTSPLRLTPKQDLPSSKIYAYAQRHLRNGLAARRSVEVETVDGGPPRGGVRAQCAVVCSTNTVGEEGEGEREDDDCEVHEKTVRKGLNPFADPAGGGF